VDTLHRVHQPQISLVHNDNDNAFISNLWPDSQIAKKEKNKNKTRGVAVYLGAHCNIGSKRACCPLATDVECKDIMLSSCAESVRPAAMPLLPPHE